MKIYFIVRPGEKDRYWNGKDNEEGYPFLSGNQGWCERAEWANLYLTKADAFSTLRGKVRENNDAYHRWNDWKPVETKDFKVVSWKGTRALVRLIQSLTDRLDSIETTLERHKL